MPMGVFSSISSFFSTIFSGGKPKSLKKTRETLVKEMEEELEYLEMRLSSSNPRKVAELLYIGLHPMLKELFHLRYQFTFGELAESQTLKRKAGRYHAWRWKKVLERLSEIEYAPRTITKQEVQALIKSVRGLVHSA